MPDADDIEKTVPSSPKKRTIPAKDPSPSAEADALPPQDLAATQRVETPAEAAAPKPRRRGWRWAIGLVVAFIVVVGLGALGGMQAGVSSRTGAERLARAIEAETQFQLALADLQNGRCDLARERFTYVSELNSSYPGILENLSQALLCSTGADTSEPGLADLPTATPDTRGREQAYSDAQALLAAQSWDELLFTLDTLRTNFPDHHPIEVDGMYYTALRSRGVIRILQVGDLEGGIYDLNRAGQIGPLDAEATNYRQWAVNYIVGQSFWEVDWEQVVNYFQPLAASAPNLHDLSFFTAQNRLATAVVFYSLDLIDQAERLTRNEMWCSAYELMERAASMAPLSPEDEADMISYGESCSEEGDAG